jgi:DNA-binding FadR family transcriptional regulator
LSTVSAHRVVTIVFTLVSMEEAGLRDRGGMLARGPFTPIADRDRVASVAQRIEDAIAAGLLPIGSRLPPEDHLATMLGVSIATLRAALRDLRALGTITTFRGRQGGSVVTVEQPWLLERARRLLAFLGPSEVRDRCDLHGAVLGEGARLGAERATAAERRALLASAASIRATDEQAAELRLHLDIVALSQSTRLVDAELACLLWVGGFLALREPTARDRMVDSIAAVASAVAEADPAGSAAAARRHVRAMASWLHERLIEAHAAPKEEE